MLSNLPPLKLKSAIIEVGVAYIQILIRVCPSLVEWEERLHQYDTLDITIEERIPAEVIFLSFFLIRQV